VRGTASESPRLVWFSWPTETITKGRALACSLGEDLRASGDLLEAGRNLGQHRVLVGGADQLCDHLAQARSAGAGDLSGALPWADGVSRPVAVRFL
jgi:hypothetical protein